MSHKWRISISIQASSSERSYRYSWATWVAILTCPSIHLLELAGSEGYLTVVAYQTDAGSSIFPLCHYSLIIITWSPRPWKSCTAQTGIRPVSQHAVFLVPCLQLFLCLPQLVPSAAASPTPPSSCSSSAHPLMLPPSRYCFYKKGNMLLVYFSMNT
jgi:hypothetical protein